LATHVVKARNEEGAFKNVPRIFCLYGQLGVGKTVFAKGFAAGLGFSGRLLSPTFIIVRRYELSSFYFYHIDLYRIHEGDKQSTETLGLREIFEDPNSIVFIEWAECLGGLLPQKRMDIHVNLEEDGTRRIIGKENV